MRESNLQTLPEFVNPRRLLNEVYRAQTHTLDRCLDIAVSAEHDDRHLRVHFHELAEHLYPAPILLVTFVQANVEQGQVGFFADSLDRCLSIRSGEYHVLFP